MPTSHMDLQQEQNSSKHVEEDEEELAALVARYLEKRGLKKTLAKFRKEAKLGDELRSGKEDLEVIFMCYITGINRGDRKQKKSKKNLLELPQGGPHSAEVNSSAENRATTQKINVECESVEGYPGGGSLALPIAPEEVKPCLAVNSSEISQEPRKSKNKLRKQNVSGANPCPSATENGDCQISSEGIHKSVEDICQGRLLRDNDAVVDDHSPGGRGQITQQIDLTAKSGSGRKKKPSTKKKGSDLDSEEPCHGHTDAAKPDFSSQSNGKKKRKGKLKDLSEHGQNVELLNEKKAAETSCLSDDEDRPSKKARLDDVVSPRETPSSPLKSSNGNPPENSKISSSKKKVKKADVNAEKHRIAEAKKHLIADAGTEQVTEEQPVVKTQLDNGSDDHVKSSKRSEVGGVRSFQRVKLEEVTFADPRLQSNSYWAKDGAEVGWGAKAEEILGQVKGRDFRHEKTKKKRGSYKGGAIDLNSRSVKFNYPEED